MGTTGQKDRYGATVLSSVQSNSEPSRFPEAEPMARDYLEDRAQRFGSAIGLNDLGDQRDYSLVR